MRPSGRRWTAAAGLVVAVLAGLLPGQPLPTAAAGTPGPCTDNVGVTVVVDFQELGGGVQVRCTTTPPTSGLQALQLAGFTIVTTKQFPGFVCRIDGAPSTDPCVVTSPTSAYWSSWHAPRAGGWCYGTLGPADRTPPPGSVEGWSFSLNRAQAPKPRYRPPAAIPGQVPNPIPAGQCAGGTAKVPRPTVGDFDGDGTTDPAVYRPSNGTWYVDGATPTAWGLSSDVPVAADFDGDGDVDRAAYRPSNGRWYVQGGATTQWGTAGDVPLPADYDGDGDVDLAVYRPSTGRWFVVGAPAAGVAWGAPGDVPVPGDYDGSGAAEPAVYRPSNRTWYALGQAAVQWGAGSDRPVPGDYDYDGTTDQAVFRPSNGTWFVQGLAGSTALGVASDVPVNRAPGS